MERLLDQYRFRMPNVNNAFRWWEAAGYAALIVVGLAMRLWDLGSRAMHHDESLHALYSWNLLTGSGYEHNPMMHGPFQFHANAAMFFVLGDNDVTARLLSAVMGTVLIVMPLLLRSRLGRLGALFASALIAASPAILYFSRFARNDILMAVWTFGLVVCMWRYFDEGRNRYLYAGAALLALLFATKEVSYLVVATLGLWSFLLVVWPHLRRVSGSIQVQGVSPPAALGRFIGALWSSQSGNESSLWRLSRPAAFLAFLVTITLPQWSAFAAILQDSALFSWTNLTLAAPDGSPNIGEPLGGASAIAFLIVVGLLGASAYFGYRWNWSVWWRCALIFYTIWTLLYTTFLTNFYGGIKSGIWQALGYWVVQQGEGRGSQPWYYYFVIGSVYEFLPLFVGVIGVCLFVRRRDRFSLFLVYWPVITFLLYTVASEKMPWLLVNVTLPFIVLVGKLLADVVQRVDWRKLFDNGGYFLIPGVPLFVVLLWNLAMYSAPDANAWAVVFPVVVAMVLIAMAVVGAYISRRIGYRNALSVSLLGVVAILLVLSVRSGVIASYMNGDTPIELIVYTQTSPDVIDVLDRIEQRRDESPGTVAIDGTSGFSWPWAWYLRGQSWVEFPAFSSSSFDTTPDDEVVIVHSNSQVSAESGLSGPYTQGERIRHRWWFPEHLYRGLTPVKFVRGIFDRSAWRSAGSYWLHREGIEHRIGSEDSYAYFRQQTP